MGLPEPKKPVPPAAIRKRGRKTRRKKAKPAPTDKRLSIIKSSGERKDLEKEKKKKEQEDEASTEDVTGRFFRQVANRASTPISFKILQHPLLSGAEKARNVGSVRLLRFYLKSARRQVRRFHARFTLKQILGFYIGVPAGISLLLCLAFFLMKPPLGVAPNMASRRNPSAMELFQQLQSALKTNDARAEEAAAAGLEKFYPKDPRAHVARGTVLANAKNYDGARRSFLHALELANGFPPALINLGEVEFAVGNYEQAANYYEQAGRRLPNNQLILFRRFLCYSLLKDPLKTEGVVKLLYTHPDSVECYFIQASEALHAGKNSEAQRIIATARTLFGEKAAVYQESLKKIGWLK